MLALLLIWSPDVEFEVEPARLEGGRGVEDVPDPLVRLKAAHEPEPERSPGRRLPGGGQAGEIQAVGDRCDRRPDVGSTDLGHELGDADRPRQLTASRSPSPQPV